MLTVTLLDRDRLPAETFGCARARRDEVRPPRSDVEARLRDLRAILGQARGRAIRPRHARTDGL